MATFFSNNPVDWYATDGLYIAEQEPPAKASLSPNGSIHKLVGEFPWGPVDELFEPASNKELFDTLFGACSSPEDYKGYRSLVGKKNGRLRIVRVSNATQAKSSRTLTDALAADAYKVTAKYPGAVGDEIECLHLDNDDGTFDLSIQWNGYVKTYQGLTLSAASLDDGIDDDFVDVELISDAADIPADDADFVALSGGSDGAFGDADYTGGPTDARGLRVLEQAEEGGVVVAAEFTSSAWITELIAHCDKMRARGVAQGADTHTFDDEETEALATSDGRVLLVGARYLQQFGGELVAVDNAAFVASVWVNIPPHVSPAAARTTEYYSAVKGLADGYIVGRDRWIQADQAGLNLPERTSTGWRLHMALMSDRTPAYRRAMADLVAEQLKIGSEPYQNEPPTPGMVDGYKASNRRQLGILEGQEGNEPSQLAEATYFDVTNIGSEDVTSQTKVKLWGEARHLIHNVTVGATVEIDEVQV